MVILEYLNGMNILLWSGRSILSYILPNNITNMAKNEWVKLNQPFESYPANTEATENPWAFSADAFFYQPKMSRTIKSLNFKNRYNFESFICIRVFIVLHYFYVLKKRDIWLW